MARARVIIANIDGRNPNVFYELGIAHALDKTTILISHSEEIKEVPFDIRNKNIVIYQNDEDLHNVLLKTLTKIFIDENKN